MNERSANYSLSVVIPTYQRAPILLKTLQLLLAQERLADEIFVVDQTQYAPGDRHLEQLRALDQQGSIHFSQRAVASIPAAMNEGLMRASSEYVLFLDDDIEITPTFLSAHLDGLAEYLECHGEFPVAQVGQVLQPQQQPVSKPSQQTVTHGLWRDIGFAFNSTERAALLNCMAGNLCVHRESALTAGGFDENFIGAAYRFETEFARRLYRHSGKFLQYYPAARIDHLQWHAGGTRASGNHLSSGSTLHSVGDYYFALRESSGWEKWRYISARLINSCKARFYLTRPWYLPVRIGAELGGLRQARELNAAGPKLLAARQLQNKPRLLAIMSHPTQHFAPVYRALARRDDICFKALFLTETGVLEYQDPGFSSAVKWDVAMTAGYHCEILHPGRILRKFSMLEMDSRVANKAIDEYQPDFVWLHGYAQAANWRVAWRASSRFDVIYSSDSNLSDSRALWRRWLKSWPVRLFFSRCHHFLATGAANQRYLRAYGVDPDHIVATHFPVDIAFWRQQYAVVGAGHRTERREQLGYAESTTVFLFAGKLLGHKRARDLVSAISHLSDLDVQAIIVGSGDQETSLRAQIEAAGLQQRVRMTGFLNQGELADYFALADVLVFPSEREPYGTIAAEVLPFALPIIASDCIGAIGQAIKAQDNALLYSAGNVNELAEHMRRLHVDVELRAKLGANSRALADSQSSEKFAADVAGICTR